MARGWGEEHAGDQLARLILASLREALASLDDERSSRLEGVHDLTVRIRVLEALVDERDGVLDLLPCPDHGRCVPHATTWIAARLLTGKEAS